MDEKQYLEEMEQALLMQIEAIRKRKAMLSSEKSKKQADDVPEMIPVTEAMDRTGLSRKRLTDLCMNGAVPHIRIGNHKILINYDELKKYIREAGRAC